MNYRILKELNYENEAIRLITFHYGEEQGYRCWLKKPWKRTNSTRAGWKV